MITSQTSGVHSLSSPSPIIKINVLSLGVYLVKPELTAQLPRIRGLGLGPLALQIFGRSLNLSRDSRRLLAEADPQSREFGPKLSRAFRGEFMPIHKLRLHLAEMDGHIQNDILLLRDGGSILLENWVFNCLTASIGKLFWAGNTGPFGEADFICHLRYIPHSLFLCNIPALNNPFTFMFNKKALKAREFVRERLRVSGTGSRTEPANTTDFLSRVRKLCESHGAGPDTWTDHQLLLISGLGPNLTAAVTWMLSHLLEGDGRLAAIVREEAESFVDKSEGRIDLCHVSEECPLLQATWYEVLRFYGTFTLGRHIRDDGGAVVAGGHLLKRGAFVLAPLRLHHFDRAVWGEDAEVFDPRRFLDASGRVDEGRARRLRTFGVFGPLCPGRFVAVHVAMAFVVRLLVEFEIRPVKRPHVVPKGRKDDVGLATPTSNTEVVIMRRENARRIHVHLRDYGKLAGSPYTRQQESTDKAAL
ncbi:cytochrome P450 [Colletotrichum sublineola]|nr:cytochrome P450 [Colletotrichum sublineola]